MKQLVLKIIYKILAGYANTIICRHNPYIIAITGSVGKTSTKEAIYSILKIAYQDQVRATAGNLNAEIGIPLTILGYKSQPSNLSWPWFLIKAHFRTKVKKYPKYLVLEMGVEHKGDIEYFGSFIKPDIGVITATTPAHIINFNDLKEMQLEKFKMASILKEGGKLVYNLDDEYLSARKFKNSVGFGVENRDAIIRAKKIKIDLKGSQYLIEYKNSRIKISSVALGRQMIYASLAWVAIGRILNIDKNIIKQGIESVKPTPGRVNLIEGKDGIWIIDDTYNSNPASLKAGLDLLKDVEYKGRKVAILGNMNELGKLEREEHQKAGQWARGKVDLAIFVGPNAKIMAKGYGLKSSKVFKDRDQMLKKLDQILKPRDLLLIKASQNDNFFEEVVKDLMLDCDNAKFKLVRQSDYWLRKKTAG